MQTQTATDYDRGFDSGYKMGRAEGYDELEEEYLKHPLQLLLKEVDFSLGELREVEAALPRGNRLAEQLRVLLELQS